MEMEDMIMATQDQALRTNTIKTTDKQNVPAKCRMAEKLMRQLTIWYWNAKNLPKSNIDVVGKIRLVQMIQWDLFCMWNAGLWQGWQIHVLHKPQPVSMYESTNNSHDPQPVYQSTNNKLLWDFKIQTDNKIEHNKPVLNEIEQKCLIIDFACPFDTWMKEKLENYPRPEAGVEMCLEIMQSNCVVPCSHNWCNEEMLL